jgi:hypothetical protein
MREKRRPQGTQRDPAFSTHRGYVTRTPEDKKHRGMRNHHQVRWAGRSCGRLNLKS